MSYFKAKMHQIRIWLGLRPHPTGGAHSVPQTPQVDLRGHTSKRMEGNWREGEGNENEERGKKGRRGKEGK